MFHKAKKSMWHFVDHTPKVYLNDPWCATLMFCFEVNYIRKFTKLKYLVNVNTLQFWFLNKKSWLRRSQKNRPLWILLFFERLWKKNRISKSNLWKGNIWPTNLTRKKVNVLSDFECIFGWKCHKYFYSVKVTSL